MKWRREFSHFAAGRQEWSATGFESDANSGGAAEPECACEAGRDSNKALGKNQKLRYQHAGDLRADLQRLRRDTEPVQGDSAKARAAYEDFFAFVEGCGSGCANACCGESEVCEVEAAEEAITRESAEVAEGAEGAEVGEGRQ